jgi:polyferredoxin
VYGGLLSALAAAGVVMLALRTPIEAQMSRVRGSLFQVDADGWVRNTYMLRVTNTAPGNGRVPYTIHVEGLEGAQVTAEPISLASTESRVVPVIVRVAPGEHMQRTVPIRVRVQSPSDGVTLDATFKTPGEIDDDHPGSVAD